MKSQSDPAEDAKARIGDRITGMACQTFDANERQLIFITSPTRNGARLMYPKTLSIFAVNATRKHIHA